MSKPDLTPWARGALTFDQQTRLHFAGLHVSVGAERSPQRFVVRLLSPDRALVAERRDVGRTVLFSTIEAMLAEAGQPLPEDVTP